MEIDAQTVYFCPNCNSEELGVWKNGQAHHEIDDDGYLQFVEFVPDYGNTCVFYCNECGAEWTGQVN